MKAATAAALAAVALICFAIRASGYPDVFAPNGVVLLTDLGDGAYHARLASWAHHNFPRFLAFDWYLAGSLGAPVPWPPLYDLVVAGVARALGAGVEQVPRILAWMGPVLGLVSVPAVYAAARVVAGRGTALAAAAIFASFGIANVYGAVGNGDHHAFVAAVAAVWLALALAFVAPPDGARRIAALAGGLFAVRTVMLLGWNGSLLYVGIADGTLAVACAALGDPRRSGWLGASALASAAMTAAYAASVPTPISGAFSSTIASWLHVAIEAALGVSLAVSAAIEKRRPAASPLARVARVAAIGAGVGLAGLALPAVRDGLAGGLRFLTLRDAAGAATYEQLPLFSWFGRRAYGEPEQVFGWLAYAVPFAPFAAARRAGEPAIRAPALLLAAWSGSLALLTMAQIRYANDFAAPGAVCFALAFEDAARALAARLGGRRRVAAAIVAAIAAVALAPSLRKTPAVLRFHVQRLQGHARAPDPMLSPAGTLVRFALDVRAATPETAGFLDPEQRPGWGILCNPNIGHMLRFYARRPVPTDNFWDNVPGFARANALADLQDEAELVAAMRALQLRYVVAMGGGYDTVLGRLPSSDGAASETAPRAERLRLVTETAGAPLGARFVPSRPEAREIPYKLFEVVEGARLRLAAAPGSVVEAEVDIATPTGRRFAYHARAQAGADGVAELRVPYATRTDAPARPTGPWRVRAGGVRWRVPVSEDDLARGAVIEVARAGSRVGALEPASARVALR